MAAKGEYYGSNKKLVKFASKWYLLKAFHTIYDI